MANALGIVVGAFGRVALISATKPVADHAHSQVHALIKLSGPDTVYQINQSNAALTDTQMILVNPWVVHSNQRKPSKDPTVLLALYIDPLWFGENMQQIQQGSRDLPFTTTIASVTPELKDQAALLAEHLANMHSDEDRFDGLFSDLVRSVLQCSRTSVMSAQSADQSFVSDHRVRKAIKAFHEAPSKELDLNLVAQSVGLSRSQFYARFRQCTGLSPRTYLDTLCWERASQLLSDPSISISEISDGLGFSAQSHFTRFFKSKTGVSPNNFRMAHIEVGMILQ